MWTYFRSLNTHMHAKHFQHTDTHKLQCFLFTFRCCLWHWSMTHIFAVMNDLNVRVSESNIQQQRYRLQLSTVFIVHCEGKFTCNI